MIPSTFILQTSPLSPLPYRGLGSGIKRALEDWPDIVFTDDRDGCQFTATVRRALPPKTSATAITEKSSQKSSQKTTQKILSIVAGQPTLNRKEIAELMGDITQDGVKYHLEKLKAAGKLRRIGPDKGGHWEVVNL